MTFINIQNTSNNAEIIPARGGFGVVINPGEKVTVCPEGETGQSKFQDLLAKGAIAERGRKRSRVLQFIQHNPEDGGYNQAA